MVFEQEVDVAAPASDVWAFLGDVPKMAACLPGLEDLRELGPDAYGGRLAIAVGPIKVKLEGRMQLELRDEDSRTTVLGIQAEDRRIRSSTNARTTMRVVPAGESSSQLVMHTDATVLGKLGQMGQAVLRKRSDQLIAQFGTNIAAAIGGGA